MHKLAEHSFVHPVIEARKQRQVSTFCRASVHGTVLTGKNRDQILAKQDRISSQFMNVFDPITRVPFNYGAPERSNPPFII